MKKFNYCMLFLASIVAHDAYSCSATMKRDGKTEVYTLKGSQGSTCRLGNLMGTMEGSEKKPYNVSDREFILKNETSEAVYARVATEGCDAVAFVLPAGVNVRIFRRLRCTPVRMTGFTVDENNKKIRDLSPINIDISRYTSTKDEPVTTKRTGLSDVVTPGRIEHHPLGIRITGNPARFEQVIIKSVADLDRFIPR